MGKALIIGYGNSPRVDDGIGCRAVELLAEGGGDVEVIACHQLTPELAPRIAEADRLILIDACAFGEPGTINEQTLVLRQTDDNSLTHHVDAAGLLAMAQILYGHAPVATLLAVSGGSFDYGETLTPLVAAAVPRLLARVRAPVAPES